MEVKPIGGPDKATRKQLKDAAKAAGKSPGGLAALAANLKPKLETADAPVAEVEDSNQQAEEAKPEEPKASNGKAKQIETDTPTEAPVVEEETIEIDLNALVGKIEALEEIVGQQANLIHEQRKQLTEMQQNLSGIKTIVAEVVNATAEAAVAGAFRKFGTSFRSEWEPRLSEVLTMVQKARQESATAASKVAETTIHLPALRALGNITDAVDELRDVRKDVLAARDQIAQLLGAPAQPAEELDPFAS